MAMTRGEFGQLVKDYFSFTRSERKGMFVLCSLVITAFLLNLVADHINFKKPADPADFLSAVEKIRQTNQSQHADLKILFSFNPNTISGLQLDSLNLPQRLKDNLVKYRSKGGLFNDPSDFKKLYGMNDSLYSAIYPFIRIESKKNATLIEKKEVPTRNFFGFDPNTVTMEELKSLGFSSFQIKNLMAYRNKGGKFIQRTDLMKIYGIDSSFYKAISSCIRIDNIKPKENQRAEYGIIEINASDSAVLTSLPGIGPAFAGRIIRYRNVLGGFHSTGQLLEVYGMTPEKFQQFSNYIEVDKSLIKPLRLNFADSKSLSQHPYLSYLQARKIVDWRSANGPMTRKEILLEKNVLDLATYSKVEPYLSCQ
jgi:DNA uptake protein ComE-like DNA-binding protein